MKLMSLRIIHVLIQNIEIGHTQPADARQYFTHIDMNAFKHIYNRMVKFLAANIC